MRYLMGSVCCLLTMSAFSEEEKSQKFSIKDISVAANASASHENLPPTDETSSQSGTITFELTSKGSPEEEVVYPIEESDFKKKPGRE